MNTRRHNRTFTFIIGLLFTGICIATHAQELAVLSTVGQAPATVVAVSGETVITATQTTFNTYVLTAEGKPIHLATATCQGPVLDLIIADGFAYTAEASFGLGVYDIRHPENPHLVAHLQPSTKWSSDPIYTVNCLALSGKTHWSWVPEVPMSLSGR